jgi:hypothetical protein
VLALEKQISRVSGGGAQELLGEVNCYNEMALD